MTATSLAYHYLVNEFFPLIGRIFITPWLSINTLWTILPLILILILIHFYFGRYRTEELGWNSAFSNTISLFWVCIILLRFLFEKYGWYALFTAADFEITKNYILVGFLTLWVILLFIFNFFHIWPKKFAFIISSADSVYISAYIVISLIVGEFPINIQTLAASIIIFSILLLLLNLLKRLVPMARGAKIALAKKKKKKKRQKAAKKAAQTRKEKKSS